MQKILIVDDKSDIRDLLSDILSDEGYKTITASNAKAALTAAESERPDLVILDIWLEGSEFDGVGVLKRIKERQANLPVIMISGHGNIETAIQTIKLGAYDFIEKPFKAEKLSVIIKRALEASMLVQENQELKKSQKSAFEIIGTSKQVEQLKDVITSVAPTQSRVLIQGETGSGKEVIARTIHNASTRKNAPFCILHSCNLTEANFEDELFGVDEGNNFKLGLLEKANGGTLFIDEITEMPLACQTKLLRTLQDQSFKKQGSGKVVEFDIRVISATSKNIEEELAKGTLNKSLLFRLNVAPIKVAPLRNRKDDIRPISQYFLKQISESMGVNPITIKEDAFSAMEIYNWPGNVRQLKNLIEWLIMMYGQKGINISFKELPDDIAGTKSKDPANQNTSVTELVGKPIKEARDSFEKIYLSAQLSRFSGNIAKTAEHIGMERTALYRKLKALKIA